MNTHLLRPVVMVPFLFLCLVNSPFATAQLSNKPPDKNAYLFDVNTNFISDAQFAMLVSNRFFSGGTTNVRDAKFLFQQCYGGGMLNELQRSLGGTNSAIPWVGGSAASWYEPSYGWGNFFTWWTRGLRFEMLNTNQTLHAAITNSITRDPLRPGNGIGLTNDMGMLAEEHGQSAFGGSGTNITLRDTNALSHHAILWAGIADNSDITDLQRIRDALSDAWSGLSNVTISTLYGNGSNDPDGDPLPADWNAMPATISNLIQTINGLPLNSNEQFFFYSTDHGGSRTHIMALTSTPTQVDAGTHDLEYFILEAGELLGIELGESTFPTLDVDYFGVTTPNTNAVFLNDVFLGYLDPSLTNMAFIVPISVLGLSNTVQIDNNDSTEFFLLHKSFFTGAIDNLNAVPEPSSLTLIFFGVVGFGLLRRRVTSTGSHPRHEMKTILQ